MSVEGLTWKPDFRKDDPWEDMPSDYAGIATFIPTEANPLPPWEGEKGAEAIPSYGSTEYDIRASGIVAETKDIASKTSTDKEIQKFIDHAAEVGEWAAGAGYTEIPLVKVSQEAYTYTCPYCELVFSTLEAVTTHITTEHPLQPATPVLEVAPAAVAAGIGGVAVIGLVAVLAMSGGD